MIVSGGGIGTNQYKTRGIAKQKLAPPTPSVNLLAQHAEPNQESPQAPFSGKSRKEREQIAKSLTSRIGEHEAIALQLVNDPSVVIRRHIAAKFARSAVVALTIVDDPDPQVRGFVAEKCMIPSILEKLAKDNDVEVITKLAQRRLPPAAVMSIFQWSVNTTTAPIIKVRAVQQSLLLHNMDALNKEAIIALYNTNSDALLAQCLRSQHIDADMLDPYLDRNNLWWAIVGNPNLKPDQLGTIARYANRKEGFLELHLAARDDLPSTAVVEMAKDGNLAVCRILMRRPRLPREAIDVMARRPFREIKLAVLQKKNVSSDILQHLANSNSVEVRRQVAKHPRTTVEILLKLIHDGDETVCRTAARHRHMPPHLRVAAQL